MQRAQLLKFLAEKIVARKKKDRPLKIGIDGRCAAGKSILADELARAFNAIGCEVLRASVDGFHHARERRYRQGEDSARGYYDDAYDYGAIVTSLFEPLSGNTFPVAYRQACFDVRADIPIEAPPLSAGADSVLLFDGIFLFREELSRYWDYRILLDVDAATSISRAIVRDTESVGPPDLIRHKYAIRYEPAWQIYEHHTRPQDKADIIIDNRDIAHPHILKGM